MSVDTACSSSLVATALARQALTSSGLHTTTAKAGLYASVPGTASSALAGGINMMLLPSTTAMFQKAGMLAPDGRCKALDAAADGYVRAEAAGMMLLGVGGAEAAVAVLAGGDAGQTYEPVWRCWCKLHTALQHTTQVKRCAGNTAALHHQS